MLEELNTYDWLEAFKYAQHEYLTSYGGAITDSFTLEDVVEIYNKIEGKNDGDHWRVWGLLKDKRFFYLEAGCDYTGWGCQESGHSSVAASMDMIISHGLTEEARKLFGLIEDNVGTIEIKKPKEQHGFTTIVKPKKYKKLKKKVEEVQINKPTNSIFSLEI